MYTPTTESQLLDRPEISRLCKKTGIRPAVAWARLNLFKKGLRTAEQLNAIGGKK